MVVAVGDMTTCDPLVITPRRRVKVEEKNERLYKTVELTRILGLVCATVLLVSTACILIAIRRSKLSIALAAEGQTFEPLPPVATVTQLNHRPSRNEAKHWFNVFVKEFSATYLNTLGRSIYKDVAECNNVTTVSIKLVGLPDRTIDGKFVFKTDKMHRLGLITFDKDGKRRCGGGDYFEVDFHDRENVKYRSRLPTVDFGNGSYGVELFVPSRFPGAFTLDIWLLFGNWHGLAQQTEVWARTELLLTQEIELVDCFYRDHPGGITTVDGKAPALDENPGDYCKSHQQQEGALWKCSPSDFERNTWQGRWTRTWFNSTCEADEEKRFRCLDEAHSWCEEPWCSGPLGRLESNGWHYSAHCGFQIFQRDEAWKCLNGRWFLMWGDSNFQDTIRNLFLFILDWELPRGQELGTFQLERSHDTAVFNVQHPDQMFRVTQHFNGANYPWKYGAGLRTLTYEIHRQQLLRYFNGTRWPDTVVMNSGLHDGDQFNTIEAYAKSADFAIAWWTQLYQSIPETRRPQLIWRSTVAPAGFARRMNANPNKMEMYNQIMAEKLQQKRDVLPVQIIDAFDVTFPFHYNNDYSDGGHYGRSPGYNLGPWKNGTPHWYFVDIMLGHIMLNAACPASIDSATRR